MNKILLDLPEYTRRAVQENLANFEIISSAGAYECLSEKKVRIGVIIDKILRDFSSSFEVAEVVFNTASQTATKAGKTIKLTEKEIALISYLHQRAGFASRQDILENVWQYAKNANTRTVESHVHRLNQRFEDGFGLKLVLHRNNAYKITD